MEEIVTINVDGAFLTLKSMLTFQNPAGIEEVVSVVSAKKRKRKLGYLKLLL